MKTPAYRIAFLVTAVTAFLAYQSFIDPSRTAGSTPELTRARADLDTVNGTLKTLRKKADETTKNGPAAESFVKAWEETFDTYNRASEEADAIRVKHGVQVLSNQLLTESAQAKLGAFAFKGSDRIYTFSSASLAGAVNYLGAYEQKFPLLSIRQIVMQRKGDKTVCDLKYMQPKFDAFLHE